MTKPAVDKRTLKLTSRQFDALQDLMSRYESEVRRCAKARAYYAACIMLGATAEAMLLTMCNAYPNEVAAALSEVPKEQRPRGSLLRGI